MVKIAVAGNATIDAVVVTNAKQISHDEIVVSFDGIEECIRVKDPPIKEGYKHHVDSEMIQKIEALPHYMQPGGGAYHSVTGMRRLPGIGKELELHYMDASIPHNLVEEGLRECGINPHFFFERDVPVHGIIGLDSDRFILKVDQSSIEGPDENKIIEAEQVISSSASLLVTGVKDIGYLEKYLSIAQKCNVPVYAVVSTSLDRDFVFEKLLPIAGSVLNYDEIPFLHGITDKMDGKSKMELTLETIRQIRLENNRLMPIYATLGKNGAYCASKESIRYVHLTEEYAERVNESIASQPRRVNGAGDKFAGALVAYDTIHNRKLSLNRILILASTVAIRHIGYNGKLPLDAFNVVEEPIKSPQYRKLLPITMG